MYSVGTTPELADSDYRTRDRNMGVFRSYC